MSAARTERERILAEREAALTSARADYEAAQQRFQHERDTLQSASRAERERMLGERETALRALMMEHEANQKVRCVGNHS